MSKINNFLKAITVNPLVSLFFSLSVLLILIFFIPKVKTVSSVDDFKLKDHPEFIFYDEFKEIFGNDEFFVIAFEEKETIFSKKNLTLLTELTQDLESLQVVREVKSLANVDDLKGGEDYFEVSPFLEEIPEQEKELESLKQQALSNKLYVSNIISPDARTAAIIVYTYDKPDDPEYRKKVIDQTCQVLDKYADKTKFHLAGWTKTNNDMSISMEKDTSVFVPLTYLLTAVLVWIFFKNAWLTVIAVLNISACLLSTMGLFGVCGITINNVTSMVLPLIMALALSDTIHIFSHLEKGLPEKHGNQKHAMFSVLSRVVSPCLLTTLTTAAGFFSLTTNELIPIRHFGFISGCGMLFEFFFSFILIPSLIYFVPPDKIFTIEISDKGMNLFLGRLSKKVITGAYKITVCAGILVACAFWFATQIIVETDFVKFFKKQSEIQTSIDFVENKMSGVGSLDIFFSADQVDAFKEPENLNVIMDIQEFAQSLKEVDVALSLVDFVKDMNESFHNEDRMYYRIPDSRQLISQYFLLYDSDDIDDFVNSDFNRARISLRLSCHGSRAQLQVINKIKTYINTLEGNDNLTIRLTGKAVQDITIVGALVKGQIYSLLSASCIIGFCMFAVLKSWQLALISFIPNLLPLLINFGVMGFLKMPLNPATALISAVSLGIVVDDTIHFLTDYKIQLSRRKTIRHCIEQTFLSKGRAIITTSLILAAGFSVLMLSSFVPTIQFGFLTAVIMLTALIGDLILLPAILMLKNKQDR